MDTQFEGAMNANASSAFGAYSGANLFGTSAASALGLSSDPFASFAQEEIP